MDSDEKEIRKLVETWMTATKAGDMDTVFSLMTEDVVFLRPGQPAMMGKAAFKEQAKPQQEAGGPRFDGTSEVKEVKVLGDWAYLWSHLEVVTTPPDGGAKVTREGHTLSVLRKQGGKWLLARDANMLS